MQRIGDGQPLPASLRHTMEQRLGVALDRVRVHTDTVASDAARAVRAEAFTVGEDIFFAEHAFAPETERGMKLLAHELVHVVQTCCTGPAATDGVRGRRTAHQPPARSLGGSAPGNIVMSRDRGDIAAAAIIGKGPGAPLPAPLSAYFGAA